jgi:hypothetical protein
VRRFFKISNTRTPAARSTRSAVNARASESWQPAYARVMAECAHPSVGEVGFAQEGIALAGGEMFADPVDGMKLHAGLRGR